MAETTFDFGQGPVPAHKHPNGGGWVADTAEVEDTAFVGKDAHVFGNARVLGKARVSSGARVLGKARVSDKARVSGYAPAHARAHPAFRVPVGRTRFAPWRSTAVSRQDFPASRASSTVRSSRSRATPNYKVSRHTAPPDPPPAAAPTTVPLSGLVTKLSPIPHETQVLDKFSFLFLG